MSDNRHFAPQSLQPACSNPLKLAFLFSLFNVHDTLTKPQGEGSVGGKKKHRKKVELNSLTICCCRWMFFYAQNSSFFLFARATHNTKLQKNGEQVYDKCRRYAVDWNLILQESDIDSLVPNDTWPLQNCDKGWEYNTTDVHSSIVIDVRTNFFFFLLFFFPLKASSSINFIISFLASLSFLFHPVDLTPWKFDKQSLVPQLSTRHVDALQTTDPDSTIWCAIRIFIRLWD